MWQAKPYIIALKITWKHIIFLDKTFDHNIDRFKHSLLRFRAISSLCLPTLFWNYGNLTRNVFKAMPRGRWYFRTLTKYILKALSFRNAKWHDDPSYFLSMHCFWYLFKEKTIRLSLLWNQGKLKIVNNKYVCARSYIYSVFKRGENLRFTPVQDLHRQGHKTQNNNLLKIS